MLYHFGDRRAVRNGQTQALWLDELVTTDPAWIDTEAEPLRGAHRVDVCVIGGGYTGLWTAHHLKDLDPSVEVMVLEADRCGSGASGRNGGFIQGWWPKLPGLIARFGADEGLRIARAAEASVATIGDFCVSHRIDAHFHQAGWLWTATTPVHVGRWEKAVAAAEAHGVDTYTRLGPRMVAERTGSATHLAGVWERSTATVQPALLARGLRRVAVERGIQVWEHSPVISLDPNGAPIIRTPEATIVAERVVLAMNAWLAAIPELRRVVVPISSDMIATAPIPDRLATLGWTDGEAITDARMMVQYYRTTRDGRIAFGRGGGNIGPNGLIPPVFDHDPARTRDVTAGFHRLYPTLIDVPLTHAWAGAVDRTEDGMLVFGSLGHTSAVNYAVGYSGNGVGPSHFAGRMLAGLVLGRQDEWTTSPLNRGSNVRWPPEPARYWGGRLVRRAVARVEADEERQHTTPLPIRRLAALAPSGMRKGQVPRGAQRG